MRKTIIIIPAIIALAVPALAYYAPLQTTATTATVAPEAVQPKTAKPALPPLDAAAIASGVNNIRAQHGLPILATSPLLEQSACAKADHMIENDYWAHDAPDGTTPWEFFLDAGYPLYKAGENLAYGYDRDQAVINGWFNSPTHLATIKGDFKEYGLCVKYGEFRGKHDAIIVNHFGTRK